jgi:hypothetical protein
VLFVKVSTMDNLITQISGYAASFFLIISFLIKDQVKLRAVNLIGCIFFVIYGFRLDYAWPIIIPNAIIAFTQIYYLWIKPIPKEESQKDNIN